MNSFACTHQQNPAIPAGTKDQGKEAEAGFKFADEKAIANPGGYRSVDSSFPEDLFTLARNKISPLLKMFSPTVLTNIRLGRDVSYRKFTRGASSVNI